MNLRLIKKYLLLKVGSRITVIYYGSRNRRERYDGIVWKVYNNIFVIKLSNNSIKCFNYMDILTKTVQIYI